MISALIIDSNSNGLLLTGKIVLLIGLVVFGIVSLIILRKPK